MLINIFLPCKEDRDIFVMSMRHEMPRQFEERSGKLFEYFLFGDITLKNLKYREELSKLHSRGGYMPYHEALELVRSCQKENPVNPTRSFLRDLRNHIARQLGLTQKDDHSLAIYSAIGSPLDIFHGVDAFIELRRGDKVQYVTLDATINEIKQGQSIKADIMIGDIPDPMEHKDQYEKELETIAAKVAWRLKGV